MTKYRKKPIIVEAYQLGVGENVPDWFMVALQNGIIVTHSAPRSPFDISENPSKIATIKPINGAVMFAKYRDYIIKGIEGEIYPCTNSVFKASYEKAEDNDCYCYDSEWDKCRASSLDLVYADDRYIAHIRPDNCPLQPAVERKCETCKWQGQLLSAGCGECWHYKLFKKDNWEKKE